MDSLKPKDYKQINFGDLPEVDELKDVSGVNIDVVVLVSEELTYECFKSRKLIYSRVEQLDAELVRGWLGEKNNAVKGNYFIFSSRGKFSDTRKPKTNEL